MAGPIAAALISAGLNIGGAILGRKKAPETVMLEPTDIGASTQESLDVNLSALGDIGQLVRATGDITTSEAMRQMETVLPGFGALRDRLTEIAEGELKDPYQLPKEIIDQLTRVAAEKGLVTGVGLQSGVGSGDLLRELGLTAMQLGQQRIGMGQNILQGLRQVVPFYDPLNPSSFFVSPSSVINLRQREAEANQEIAQGGANVRASVSNANRKSLVESVVGGLGGMRTVLEDAGYFGKKSSSKAPAGLPPMV